MSVINLRMDKPQFLKLMNNPEEWIKWGLFPDELAIILIIEYQAGDEESSEHTRAGAFHWWLSKGPSEGLLSKLMYLASIDPEPYLGSDARKYIQKSPNYFNKVEEAWDNLFVTISYCSHPKHRYLSEFQTRYRSS